MRSLPRTLVWLHARLVCLYPPGFRAEFEAEMRQVFLERVAETEPDGPWALLGILVGEVRDLPVAVLRQHLRERRLAALGAHPAGEVPGSPREVAVSLALFMVPAVMVLISLVPASPVQILLPGLMLLLLVALLAGLAKGLPRWSLPYLGLALAFLVFVFGFQWVAERLGRTLLAALGGMPVQLGDRLLLEAVWAGLGWMGFLLAVTLVVFLLPRWAHFQPFLQRLRKDWVQVTYLMYGGCLVVLLIAFDEYQYAEPYTLLAMVSLAAGAWGYLRAQSTGQRLAALLAGMTACLWIAALGKWLLVPRQNWEIWFLRHPPAIERWLAAGSMVIVWIWVVLALLLAPLLAWLVAGGDSALSGRRRT